MHAKLSRSLFFVSSLWLCLPAFAGDSGASSVGFAASAYQLAEPSLYCDMPSIDALEPAVSSKVNPIWQVDFEAVDMGYIADDYTGAAGFDEAGDLVIVTAATSPQPLADSGFGMRLTNGWSLGLAYETIDTSLKIGSNIVDESIGPVYEGPLFVATLKFR